MLTTSTNLLDLFGCYRIIISLYYIIINRMNQKKYIYSLNNLKKGERIRFIYSGKLFQKKNVSLRLKDSIKKWDHNLLGIIIISNLQGQSLLRADKSSWLLYRTHTGDLIFVLGINTQITVSRPDKRCVVWLKTSCDT